MANKRKNMGLDHNVHLTTSTDKQSHVHEGGNTNSCASHHNMTYFLWCDVCGAVVLVVSTDCVTLFLRLTTTYMWFWLWIFRDNPSAIYQTVNGEKDNYLRFFFFLYCMPYSTNYACSQHSILCTANNFWSISSLPWCYSIQHNLFWSSPASSPQVFSLLRCILVFSFPLYAQRMWWYLRFIHTQNNIEIAQGCIFFT